MFNPILGILASSGAVAGGSYESIASTTVGSATSSVTFTDSGAWTNYKHLQLRIALAGNTTGGVYYQTQVGNGSVDTSNNYNGHFLWTYGGGTVDAGSQSGVFGISDRMMFFYDQGQSGSEPIVTVIDYLDYGSTSKYKTVRSLAGRDRNGSGQIWFSSGLWRSTSAIDRIKVSVDGTNNMPANSIISLYGIKD